MQFRGPVWRRRGRLHVRLLAAAAGLERALVREGLSRSGGNQTRAAELLGLSRFGLQKKLRRYGIS